MIDYEEDWIFALLTRTAGSVSGRACCFAIPATLLTVGLLFMDDYAPEIREENEFLDFNQGTIWSAVTAMMLLSIGFRTRNAYGRFWEGTGLLHQMRGEWFDTVSNCVTFSIKGKNKFPEEVLKFRHTLVRLMSLAHGNALEEISDNQFELDTIDPHGLDVGTLRHLKDCHERCKFNKVEVILHLIQSLITTAHLDGLVDIPPPILSRVFQTISRGFVNLLNSKKITDTKFPFPYVQLIAALMLGFSVMTPVVLSSFIPNKVVAAIVTFIPVFGVASLNAIAQELENPFGMDDNDLPIAHFQEEMDRCLLMLLHPNADSIPTTSARVELDFDRLLMSLGNDNAPSMRLSELHPTGEPSPPGSPKLAPWKKGADLPERKIKTKRLDTNAIIAFEMEEESLQGSSTPVSTSSFAKFKSPRNNATERQPSKERQLRTLSVERMASKEAKAQPIKETPQAFEAVASSSNQKDSPLDANGVDQQNLTTDLKVLLKTNISTFVKCLESMTNALQNQVDMLNATSDIIHDYASNDSQLPTMHPLASVCDRRKTFEQMANRWEKMQNTLPTLPPALVPGKDSVVTPETSARHVLALEMNLVR